MIKFIRFIRLEAGLGFLIALTMTACQPMTNNNANVNSNSNANSSANSNLNSNSGNSASTTGAINTREPDKYSATLTFSLQTQGGDKAIGIPSLSISVARNGDDRRL